MKSFIVALLAALAAAAPAPGADLTWTGDIQDGGAERTFTGTAESVYNQILEANPAFQPLAIPEHATAIQKRTAYDCEIFSDIPANADGIVDQINYLYRIGGSCGFTPGCTRVSCSFDNAIFACSRTGGNYNEACTNLADRASGTLGRCTRGGKVWGRGIEPAYFVDVHTADC